MARSEGNAREESALPAMVVALGRGGQARVVEATGMSTSTVNTATREVRAGVEPSERQRRPGRA